MVLAKKNYWVTANELFGGFLQLMAGSQFVQKTVQKEAGCVSKLCTDTIKKIDSAGNARRKRSKN